MGVLHRIIVNKILCCFWKIKKKMEENRRKEKTAKENNSKIKFDLLFLFVISNQLYLFQLVVIKC